MIYPLVHSLVHQAEALRIAARDLEARSAALVDLAQSMVAQHKDDEDGKGDAGGTGEAPG